MSTQKPSISSRLASTVPKRDIMWNIIEPGDPYDIRRSMIAKLPGRKNFMGEHLELVCLLQAAQIERLCEYLEQHKLKLRQVERRELDRHSYEVQIKQLTQRISDQGNFKAENIKLREFLRKQSAEYEGLRTNIASGGSEEQLMRRYGESLRQVEYLMHENEEIKDTLIRMREEHLTEIAAKDTVIQGLQRRLKEGPQLGRSESIYKMEVETKKLQFENRRLRETGQARTRELQEVQTKCKQLIYQLEEQSAQARQFSNLSATIQQYENRFSMLGEEIDRLNKVLRDKTAQNRELGSKYRGLEEEKRQQASHIADLESRKTQLEDYNRHLELSLKDSSGVDESRTIIRTYEVNLQKLSLEIQRLNKVLRMKMGELEEAERRASQLESDLGRSQAVKRQVEEFRGRFSELNRKMSEYQNRIALSTQEIQRLNQILRRKNDEVDSLESRLKAQNAQLQNAQSQSYHLEIEYKTQINYLTTNYEERITELQESLRSRGKPITVDPYSAEAKKEFQRLNSIISNKEAQIQHLRGTLDQNWSDLESKLGVARQDNQNLRGNLEQYESRIIMLSQEIERLNTVIKKTSPTLSPVRKSEESFDLRKLTEYENKLAILSQQIDRLNDNIRARDIKIKNYEQELQTRRRQPQQPDNQQQMTNDYQVSLLKDQVSRLNELLNQKSVQYESLEQRFRVSSREADDLKKKLVEYEYSMEELSQRAKGSIQISMQYQIDGYKRRIAQLEKRISDADTLTRDYDARYRTVEQQSRLFEQQSRMLEQQVRSYQEIELSKTEGSRKLSEYEPKMIALSKEIERLNSVLERFSNQNQDLKRKLYEAEQLKAAINALEERLALASQENQSLRKSLNEKSQFQIKTSQDYELKMWQINTEREQILRRTQEQDLTIKNLENEREFANSAVRAKNNELSSLLGRYQSLQQDSQSLNRKILQLSNTTRKINEYDTKITLLSQEVDRLNGVLRGKLDENASLESKCRNYESELNNYQRKVSDFENNITRELQGKNTTLTRQNEEYRSRIKQLSMQTARVSEFQNKLALTLGQVERLNDILKSKLNEIETLSSKMRVNEQELERSRRRNDELESTMHRQLKNQSAIFQQRISQLSDENDAIRRGVRDLSDANRIIPDLQNKLGVASGEVERLNSILLKFTKEIVPGLEQKSKGLALECDEYRQRCSQLGESNKQGLEAAARLKLLTQENEQTYRKMQQYQNRITNFSAEIERLNGVLRNKIEQLGNTEVKLRQVQTQNEQLQRRFKDSSQTAKRIPEYEAKIALLSQQFERLNGVLRAKTEELASAQSKVRMLEHDQDSLQRRISQHESSIVEHKRLRATLEERLTGAGSQNEELRRSIRDLADSNRRISEYESRITLLSQEVDRLNVNLRTKTEELTASEGNLRNAKREAEGKITVLSSQLEEYRRKASENIGSQASRLAEYESKMVVLSKEIERLNIVLKETTFELDGSRGREKQCLLEIERLNNTLRLKVEETTRWDQANSQLKNKLRISEQSLSTATSELEKARSQYNQLAQQYKKSNQHMIEYEQSINKLYQEFERLQSIIQSLKKENYDLKLSLQQAGNLVEKNRVLSAEIDRLMKLIEQQTTDLEELRLALADQSALQKRISEYMALLVVLFAEIQSLRRRVKDTEKEIQDVRRSSLAPFKV